MLHIRDEATDRLVRELARRRGITLTEAVRQAVSEALAIEDAKPSLWERTADLRARLATYPPTGKAVDKQFFDDLHESSTDFSKTDVDRG